MAAVLAGLLAISLLLAGGPVLGHARDPEEAVDATPPIQPPVSRIVAGMFYSQAMQQRQFEIYLPPSYDQDPERTYPVLYLLHGDGGRVGDWAAFGLRPRTDQAIAGGGPEMIVVMPDGSGSSGHLTDWADRWDGTDRVEEQVIELVSWSTKSTGRYQTPLRGSSAASRPAVSAPSISRCIIQTCSAQR